MKYSPDASSLSIYIHTRGTIKQTTPIDHTHFALWLLWREWSVVLLRIDFDLSSGDGGLGELGEEPIPRLSGEGGVFHQLTLDHQCLCVCVCGENVHVQLTTQLHR